MPVQTHTVLRGLSFGAEASENEVGTNFEASFIRGSVFDMILRDEVDLIVGAKGTGKSAIVRRLSRNGQLPHGVTVVSPPAMVADASFVQTIGLQEGASEADLTAGWMLFFLTLTVREIFWNRTGDPHAVGRLHGLGSMTDDLRTQIASLYSDLRDAGLVQNKMIFSPERDRRTYLDVIKGFRLKASYEFDPSRSSSSLSLSPYVKNDDDRQTINPYQHISAMAQGVCRILEQLGARVWIVIDSIDEALSGYPPEEQDLALRSMMRAHLDLMSLAAPLVRTKIFIRSDVFVRISRERAFPGATRLRKAELNWNANEIKELLAARCMLSADFRGAYGLMGDALSRDGWSAVINGNLIPQYFDQSEKKTTLDWILSEVADGWSLGFNPRNVITYFNRARERELERRRHSSRTAPKSPLLSVEALQGGFGLVSKARLDDTVEVEFPQYRSALKLLRGQRDGWTLTELIEALELSGQDGESAARDLEAAGFFKVMRGRYHIAPVYRREMRTPIASSAKRAAPRPKATGEGRESAAGEATARLRDMLEQGLISEEQFDAMMDQL